jgi:AcrR family transcriptional regulator
MTTARDPRPLSAQSIVDAALEIADAEGLSAVTMRSVGARLGVAAMSLYRHVANKDTLLELMADQVLAELPVPDPQGEWQAEMETFWMALRELLLEHPAVAGLMLEMPIIGPEISVRGEATLACLVNGGLDDELAVQALTAMTWYTVGGALHAIATRNPEGRPDRGVRLADLPGTRYPTVRRLTPHLDSDATAEFFRRGLRRLIRGYVSD